MDDKSAAQKFEVVAAELNKHMYINYNWVQRIKHMFMLCYEVKPAGTR